MKIPAHLAAHLRCPRCGGTLLLGDQHLTCAAPDCGRQYPLVDGVPILIDEDRSLFDIDSIAAAPRTPPDTGGSRVQWRRWLPVLSRNYRAADNYRELRRQLEESGATSVLVVGGGTAAIGIQELKKSRQLDIVETDVFIGPHTGAVCDAHQLPFADEVFDAVIIQGVICYLQDPPAAIAEIHRVLKPAGWVYSETPFVQQVTGGRYDFVRYTEIGHRRLFHQFSEFSSGPVGGPGMVLAWSWHYFLLSFVSTRRARSAASVVARLTAFWLPLVDRWLGRRPWAVDSASGVFFLGQKSDRVTPDRQIISRYSGGLA